jgi:acyl dehydratase
MDLSELVAGQALTFPAQRLGTDRIKAFAAVSGDDSPTHLTDAAARMAGFPKALSHGMLGMAFMGRLLLEAFPGTALTAFTCRFTAMTFHDDALECIATVDTMDAATTRFTLSATNQDGVVVLTGTAEMSSAEDAIASYSQSPSTRS